MAHRLVVPAAIRSGDPLSWLCCGLRGDYPLAAAQKLLVIPGDEGHTELRREGNVDGIGATQQQRDGEIGGIVTEHRVNGHRHEAWEQPDPLECPDGEARTLGAAHQRTTDLAEDQHGSRHRLR